MHASALAHPGVVLPASLTLRRKFSQIQWPGMTGFKARYFQPPPRCQKGLIKARNEEAGLSSPFSPSDEEFLA